jgi:hypothetical protein
MIGKIGKLDYIEEIGNHRKNRKSSKKSENIATPLPCYLVKDNPSLAINGVSTILNDQLSRLSSE